MNTWIAEFNSNQTTNFPLGSIKIVITYSETLFETIQGHGDNHGQAYPDCIQPAIFMREMHSPATPRTN